ncbi:MAG: T9SS type A sorting domain-containing protein [bacterium]
MKYFFIIFLLLSNSLCFSQNEGKVWYFGHYAGLDFCSGTPIVLKDGMMDTKEGCASIADKNCGLLFYTDGITVWNRSHKVMPNGTGLMGDSSATQSGVIVPLPGSDKIYYLFTVDDNMSSNGLRYSIVDMNLEGGLGDIIDKNVLLMNDCTEKITAVKHANGIDIWVIAHEFNSNGFRIWLLTPTGLVNYKTVNVGFTHQGTGNSQNKIGYLTVSPDGKKLALAVKGNYLLEFFDFDDSTGDITNPRTIQGNSYAYSYGVGFSPDGKRLYVGTRMAPYKLHQFNMESADIINSGVELARTPMEIGAIQAGPDGKIYIALRNYPYLGVINKPGELGTACEWVQDGLFLEGRTNGLGLPTFIQTYFKPEILLNYNGPICEGETIMLNATFIQEAEYFWSGPNGFTSTLNNPVITNAQTNMSGQYKLKVIFPNNLDSSFYYLSIDIYPKPDVGIIPAQDTTIIEGTSIELNATPFFPENTYLWSTGETTQMIIVDVSGIYTVYAENEFGCIDSASVEVKVIDMPDVKINSDKSGTICVGDSVILRVNPYNSNFNYFWSTGETGQSIRVFSSGTYSVSVEGPSGTQKESEIFDVRFEENKLAIDQRCMNIDFGQINLLSAGFMSVFIVNLSTDLFNIEDILIKKNNYFSIPQSQFNLTINPGDTAEITVCFLPGFIGIHNDSLIIQDSCQNHIIPLSGIGSENTYYGEADCDVTIKAQSTDLLYYRSIYPNPFAEFEDINYFVSNDSKISIKVYNTLGNEIALLLDEEQKRGEHSITWKPVNLPSGIYFCNIKTGNDVKTRVLYYIK